MHFHPGIVHPQTSQGRQQVLHRGQGGPVLPQGGGPGAVHHPGIVGLYLRPARQVGADKGHALVGGRRVEGRLHPPAGVQADAAKT